MDFETIANMSQQKDVASTDVLKTCHRNHLEALKGNWPIKKTEAYKFTGLRSFFDELEIDQKQKKPIHLNDYQDNSSINIIYSNGEIQLPDTLPKGLQVFISNDIQDINSNQDVVSNLHHSLRINQLKILVEKNVIIEPPIRVIQITSNSELSAPSIAIHLKPFSQASIIEEILNPEATCGLIHETEVVLEENSKLEHIQLTQIATKSIHVGQTNATIGKDGFYSNFLINASGRMNRKNLDIKLLQSGAHAETYNLYLTSENEHSDINTVIHHLSPDTTSAQLAKGILSGDSKGIFTGKIFIHPKAQRVSSSQTNKNLLLSKKAQCHSQPQLEIFADDVKCSHGSTTGQLSDDEIFYFESRGIPASKAKTLLAFGFALEIVSKIKNKVLRKNIESSVLDNLKLKFKLGNDL